MEKGKGGGGGGGLTKLGSSYVFTTTTTYLCVLPIISGQIKLCPPDLSPFTSRVMA